MHVYFYMNEWMNEWKNNSIDKFPYIVDWRQGGYHVVYAITGRLQIPTRASRQMFCLARVFSPMAPSLDGERTRQLANTLFGAK